jgi:ketosteroid isomerase-like protein
MRFALLMMLFGSAAFSADSSKCPASTADEAQIVESVRTMYSALTSDDLNLFRSVVAPEFYAYDGGKRFEGEALLNTIKTAHAAGTVFVWTVNEPEVHVSCETAWISYVNRGTVRKAAGTTARVWLESAVLRKESGKWRIQFFHSTPVPMPVP